MNDEIKEILDKCKRQIKNDLDYRVSPYQLKQLLDYITNLQQENEKLLSENIVIKSVRNMVDETIYKSRCEKAVGYLKKEKSNYMRSCDISNATNREGLIISSAVRTCDDTLNILNGRSDE